MQTLLDAPIEQSQLAPDSQAAAIDKPPDDWFKLSPIQQLYLDHAAGSDVKYVHSAFLRLSRHVPPSQIGSAILQLGHRHPMLRARFGKNAKGEWAQRILEDVQGSIHLREHYSEQWEDSMMLKAIENTQMALDITEGPLTIVNVFQIDKSEQYLSFTTHHLVIDLVSWRILLQDLENALTVGVAFDPLPPVTFKQWCLEQEQFAIHHLDPEVALPVNVPPIPRSYWGQLALEHNSFADADHESFMVDEEATAFILGPAQEILKSEPTTIIHAALLYSFAQTFDDRSLPTIFTEGHGREPWDDRLDLSQTIGWFTTIYPVVVQAPPETSFWELLGAAQKARSDVPRNGWAYFTSRFLNPKGREVFKEHTPIEILFNYTGKFRQLEHADRLLQLTEAPGQSSFVGAANLERFDLVDINVAPFNGRLLCDVMVNRHMQHRLKIREWFAKFRQLLAGIPQDCHQFSSRGWTTADFPLLSISEGQLKELMDQVTSKFQVPLSAIEDIYPCSPMQRGILLSQIKNPALYQTRFTWVVKPKTASFVDINHIQEAWKRVVSHHAILRTVFVDGAGQENTWSQVVLHSILPNIVIVKDQKEWNAETESASSAHESSSYHRLMVMQRAPRTVSCCLEINHALFDGATISLLVRDFQLAYDNALPLIPALSYRSYISYLHTLSPAAAVSYWARQFSGLPPSILPGMATPQTTTNSRSRRAQSFTAELPDWSTLSLFCKSHGLTTATLLQTAWGLTLRSYTGASDVCFGYPTAGRDIPVAGIHDLAGPLINLLPCALHIKSDSTSTVLREHQDSFVRGLQYQNISLSDILHALGRSGEPLFNTALSVMHSSNVDSAYSTVSLELESGSEPTEFDVVVHIEIGSLNAAVSLVYWDDVIPDFQAQLITDTFLYALSQIVQNPSLQMIDLDPSSPRGHRQILKWNSPIPDVAESCIHELIVQNVSLLPQALAICAWDGAFTFAELDHLSSQLASYLRAQGVDVNTFVPVYMTKSRWTPVALLAVLKTRAAFLLLDATHPASRMETLCRDIPCGPVLTNLDPSNIDEGIFPRVIRVDVEHSLWTSHAGEFALAPGSPKDAAYAVFTSGSTGKPKMVVIEHQSFCSAAKTQIGPLGLSPESRVLQFASYAFDAAVLEHLTTLIAGGCICIPNEPDRQQNLTNAMNELEVNWALLTPPLARTLNHSDLPGLRTLVLGSEACRPSDLIQWASIPRLLNAYGPSECAVITTLQQDLHAQDFSANIGKGAGATCWIVHPNNHHRLTNVGAIGELLIEGPIVGRGYFGLEEKTAQSFITPPVWLRRFRGHARSRLYKTGDLVQYSVTGSLRYFGRKDTQVKIRGQRLELGEVEHHLSAAMPAAQEVISEIAMIPERGMTKPYLVAFVINTPSHSLNDFSESWACARSHLQVTLPPYMVPSGCFLLPSIPRTATEKVDRNSLRKEAIRLLQEQWNSPRAPVGNNKIVLSDVEYRLRNIWADALGRDWESISVHDNFFHIGGDSIEAPQVVRIAHEQGLKIKLHDIFTSPRLKDLAAKCITVNLVKEEALSPLTSTPFSLLPAEEELRLAVRYSVAQQCSVSETQIQDIYPCTPLQIGMMALTAQTGAAYVLHRQYFLPPDVDLNRAKMAWKLTAQAHPIMRTRIVQLRDGQVVQAVLADEFHWEPEQTVDGLTTMEYGSPLWYFTLSLQANRWCLTISLHHSVGDAWSLSLLLQAAHASYQQDNQLPLSSPPPSQHFIQRLSPSGANEFWRRQFEGLSPIPFPSLPSALYRPKAMSRLFASVPIQNIVGQRTTLTNAIRLAWSITQSLYQGCASALFGIISSGRNASIPGIDKMTGPTIATVPLLVSLDSNGTVEQAIEELRIHTVRTMQFEQAGLQNIARLGPNPAAACAFQTLVSVFPAALSKGEDHSQTWQPSQRQTSMAELMTYSLSIECTLRDEMVGIGAWYDEHVLPAPYMQRILRQFMFTLQQVDLGLTRRLDQIMVPCPDELREQYTFNPTLSVQPTPSFLELLQFQCQNYPHINAIDSWDGSLTYGEIGLLSDRLGRHICSLRLGRSEFYVPLLFEKSQRTIIALLAVLKSGGAFVLMDPSHPLERLKEIAHEVRAAVVLASPAQASKAKLLADRVIVVDDTEKGWETDEAFPEVDVKHPLYAVFTSGSTGRPKGVVVEHRSFVTMALAFNETVGLRPGSRMLQFASYAFDASILEILAPLIAGSSVIILSDADRHERFQRAIDQQHPTHALLTPSFVRALSGDTLSTIETLILGGEAVRTEDVGRWRKGLRVMNAYGPAECSVVSTIQPNAATAPHASNIGRPLSSACWVVNPNDPELPVPIGTVGELLVEGPSVARGYINNVEQTVVSFVPCPTWLRALRPTGTLSDRVYLTGDLVRYESDGSLSYCGRKDAEFKIRGQRVHMGEIENQVQQTFPGIQDVMVDMVSFRNKRQSMVAFLQVAVEQEKNIEGGLLPPSMKYCTGWSEARSKLEDVLPDYMVPNVFLPVVDIPQTTTGKTDRSRLRQTAESLSMEELQTYSGLSELKRPVSTAVERLLQATWAGILGFDKNQIGPDDSFFRLGGDSISAMQASSQARTLGVIHSVADLLRWKTLAQVATHARYEPTQNDIKVASNSRDSFRLTPYQQSILRQPNRPHVDIRVRLTQRVPIDKIQRATATVVHRHPMLRARFMQNARGVWEQFISPVSSDAYYFCVQDHQEKFHCERLSSVAHQTLDISNGPVFRVDVIDDLAGNQELHIAAHAIILDWTSLQILCRHLEQLLYDEDEIFPDVSGPGFREWCTQQCQTQKEETGAQSEGQWQPSGIASGISNSPLDKPMIAQEFTLTQQVAENLQSISACVGLSLQTVLMACLHCSFAREFPTEFLPAIITEQEVRPYQSEADIIGPFCVGYTIPSLPTGCDDLLQSLRRCKEALARGQHSLSVNPSGDREVTEVRFMHKRQIWTRAEVCLVENSSTQTSQGTYLSDSAVRIEVTEDQSKLHFHALGHNTERVKRWLESLKGYLIHILPTNPVARQRVFITDDFPLLPLANPELDVLLGQVIPARGLHLNDVETIYPCSPVQNGFLYAQERDAIWYHASVSWRVHSSSNTNGYADSARLQKAWRQVVARHESLRTVFAKTVSGADFAYNVILKSGHVPIDRVSCEEPAPGELPHALSIEPSQKLATGEIMHNFTVCETDAHGLFARLDTHHTIVDGYSLVIMQRDLCLAYDGLLDAEQTSQYRDYVSWVQQDEAANGHRAESYWKEYLNGYSPFHLPLNPTGSFDSNSRSAFKTISVDLSKSARLDSFCANLDITMSTVFHLAWGAVLWRFTGSSDVCFGSFIAGRDADLPGIQDTVGLILNLLVCRVSINKDDTFRDLLRIAQANHSNSLSHRSFPLAKVAQAAALPVDELVRTVVNFRSFPVSHVDSTSSLQLTRMTSEEYTDQDLTLIVESMSAGLDVTISYRSSKISDFLAAQMADYLNLIISTMLARPDTTFRELSGLLSTKDQARLVNWSFSTAQKNPRCLHPIIERWAHDQPQALAATGADGTLTYKDLDLLSSNLAGRIIAQRIRPRTFIPLYFEKSRWVIVAVLAVVKAGCAFLLLDPSHPLDRLQSICSEISASLILCSKDSVSTGAALAPRTLVVSDDNCSHLGDAVDWVLPKVSPDDPLYMMFTSGSTGMPKGAVVHHSAFVSSNNALIRPFGLDSTSTVLHFCSYSFDVSIQEILLTLMAGGTIGILSDAGREEVMLRGYSQLPVTHAIVTPSVADLLDLTRARSWVSTIILIGEPVSRSYVQRWAGVVRLINSYGPAECSVTTHCTGVLEEDSDSVNIGKPNGAFAWVIDPHDPSILAPVGAVGELVLDGPAVGRGYFNEPDKTAAAFILPPSWPVERSDSGSRCYRTGDLVRYEADGTLRFEGRQGTQAKLRGMRIELGEIEYQAKRHFPGATGAVAEVLTLTGGAAHIVTFVTVDKNTRANPTPEQPLLLVPDSEFFRAVSLAISGLQHVLPAFMVPSFFIPLSTFPQTRSNKTDRRQLRELVLTLSDGAITEYSGLMAHREPSNPQEESLRQIWGQILGIEPSAIGVDDDLFQLGGDSVAAMRIASTAREAGFQIAGHDILLHRRISRLAT